MIKQIIIMRTDLFMRKGKMIAQGCHASLGAANQHYNEYEWEINGHTKICVRIDSLEELEEIYKTVSKWNNKASFPKDYIPIYKVTDAGRTEFHDVPTVTCMAIGPARDELIDKFTGHLKLL